MCGRAQLTVSPDDLEQTFGFAAPGGYQPRYNIAPSQPLLTVLPPAEKALGFRELNWGLVPSWADDVAIGRKLLLSRAETIASKPAFRDAFARQRCLVVVDGFYEWKSEPGGRRPHRVHLRGDRPFTLAAIWDRWGSGEARVESCAIVTTSANQLMCGIHDRMPVIIPPERRREWLSTDSPPGLLRDLLAPYPGNDLEAYEVSTYVNHPGNDGPECIAPVAAAGVSSPPVVGQTGAGDPPVAGRRSRKVDPPADAQWELLLE